MMAVAQVSHGQVDGDAARPGAEAAVRIEARAGAIDAPGGLDGQVFGEGGIRAPDGDPAVDVRLVGAEQFFERVDLTRRESPGQVHKRLHLGLP